MVRLKKLQRNPKLREPKFRSGSRSPTTPERKKGTRCTLLNCLACLCLIANVLVLSLSMMINRRLKEDAIPPPGTAPANGNSDNNNNAAPPPVTADKGNDAAIQPALRGNTENSAPATTTETAVAAVAKTTSDATGGGKNKYHFVFTSDCKDPTQDWQVYVFFFHIAKTRQQGEVTHIVTGCQQGGRRSALEQFHQKNFEPLGRDTTDAPSRFHLHFAPVHPQQVNVGLLRTHMKYFNRPYGVQDWMENKLGYSAATSSSSGNPNDDTVIVLMDADMAILKPFGETFNNQEEMWKQPLNGQATQPTSVVHGHPVAQHHPFPPNWWQEISSETFSGEIHSGINALKALTATDLDNHYAAGAPFLVTGKDFYPLVQKWNQVTYPLHQALGEKVLREPHAGYALAAAMEKKPHQLSGSFAVSNYRDTGFGLFLQAYREGSGGPGGGTGALCRKFPQQLSPHVLQYAKRYALGNFIIGKHYVQQNFLGKPESCSAPLFAEPPENVAEIFNYYKDPEINSRVNIDTDQHVHTMTFMVCETIQAFNEAASHFKRENCIGDANLQKTLTFD